MIAHTESLAAPTTTLAEIEASTKRYASTRALLTGYITELNNEIELLKRSALPRIKELVARVAERETELRGLIDSSHGLFEKPRTQIFHGIKVGLRKGNGGIDWDDDEQTVKLIRKHLSQDEADLLIKTTERPIAKAMAELDVATLKKLGCTVEDTGDVVVVRATDSEIEKVVNALLKGTVEKEAA